MIYECMQGSPYSLKVQLAISKLRCAYDGWKKSSIHFEYVNYSYFWASVLL